MSDPVSEPGTPSAGSLLRSTGIALLVAGVLLITCVLPAEYGMDPTGIGRLLGLTQMGEVKLALAEEAANNAAAEASADSVIAASESSGADVEAATVGDAAVLAPRVDTTLVTLTRNMGGEIKLVMPNGTRVAYQWAATGGVVNFDMHGDSTNAPKNWSVSYRKGQGAAADSGDLVARFTGNHGWYWRNRGRGDVLVRLITSGAYERIEKHL
ncbi:MAG: transmembrane anchor protein [Gemmatimonadaceae bacterium]|nr:transmembrane anchor protein [Gemmatimonadaceae bacterium]